MPPKAPSNVPPKAQSKEPPKARSKKPPKAQSEESPEAQSEEPPKAQSEESPKAQSKEPSKRLSDEGIKAFRSDLYREAVIDLMYEHIQYCCTGIIKVLGKKDPEMAEELAVEFEKFEEHFEERWGRLLSEEEALSNGTFHTVITENTTPSGATVRRVAKNEKLK
ncbi:hypothetical protein V8F33_003794 [Rhypophila sp. PSN 637]